MNVVILKAGGLGTRAKQVVPKQFVVMNGKPLIVHTLECFERCEAVDEIVVSITTGFEQDIYEFKEKYNLTKVKHVVTGGRSGLESIKKGYEAIQHYPEDTVVIVHEANRPIVTKKEIINGIEMTRKNQRFGMSYRHVTENIVGYIDAEGRIQSSSYYAGFAIFVHPEYVNLKNLRSMMENASEEYLAVKSSLDQLYDISNMNTDHVNMIQSSFNNIKVTFPEDFEVVAKYIETTKEETKTDYMISKDTYSENVANN